jgi:4-amino-4-deoxy-L-arabinose transferase-like glycosyltransferase
MQSVTAFKDKIVSILKNKQNLVLTVIILALAAFWRLFLITKIPMGASAGEVNLVNTAIEIINHNWLIAGSNITNSLYLYFISVVGKLTNFNLLYLRVFQATLGIFSVYLLYLFVKNWFNRQTAMLAALLFGASAFHVAISRQLTPDILLPVIFIAVFYFITGAFRTNKNYWFVLAGISFGLGLYINSMFALIPALFIITAVYFYFKNTKFITGYINGILFGVLAFVVTSLPFLYFLPSNFFHILSSFNPGSIGKFYLNLGNLIQSLFYLTPSNFTINVGTEPLLDPFITITFGAGLIYAIFNLKRKKFLFLVGWFVLILILLAMRSVQDLSGLIILFPAIYTIAAVMMDYVLTKWVRTFPFNMSARLVMTFVFSLFLFMSIFYNYQKYFLAYANSRETKNLFDNRIEYNNK